MNSHLKNCLVFIVILFFSLALGAQEKKSEATSEKGKPAVEKGEKEEGKKGTLEPKPAETETPAAEPAPAKEEEKDEAAPPTGGESQAGETIEMLNGDTIRGRILRLDDNCLVVAKTAADEKDIRAGRIKGLRLSLDNVLFVEWHGRSDDFTAKIDKYLEASMAGTTFFQDMDFEVKFKAGKVKDQDATYNGNLGVKYIHRNDTEKFGYEFMGSVFLNSDSNRADNKFSFSLQDEYNSDDSFATGVYKRYLKGDTFVFGGGKFKFNYQLHDRPGSRALGGAGYGRIYNIASKKKMEAVETFMMDAGLLKRKFSIKMKRALTAIFDTSANPQQLTRRIASLLKRFNMLVNGRELGIDQAFEIVQIIEDSFKERLDGLELRGYTELDLITANEGESNQMSMSGMMRWYKPISDKIQFVQLNTFYMGFTGAKVISFASNNELTYLVNEKFAVGVTDQFGLNLKPTTDLTNSLQGVATYFVSEQIDLKGEASANLSIPEIGPTGWDLTMMVHFVYDFI